MLDDTTIVDDFTITDEEIKRYNAKIARYAKKDTEGLPHSISRSQIDSMDDSEKLRLKEDIADFMKRDSMRIDKPSGERKWFKRRYDRIFEENRKMEEEMASYLEPSTEKGTMGSIAKLNLAPKTNRFNNLTHNQRKKSMAGMEVQLSKNQPETYKANFLKALETEFGSKGLSYQEIRKIVENMDGKTLYALYAQNSDLQIDFIYSEGEDAEDRALIILKAFLEEGYGISEAIEPSETADLSDEEVEAALRRMVGLD